MILSALEKYYQRMKGSPGFPEPGFAEKNLSFALLLSPEGELIGQPIDLRRIEGKKAFPKILKVPISGSRANDIKPYFLWDKTDYVLGSADKGKPERILECFQAFKDLHKKIIGPLQDKGGLAVLKFLRSWNPEKSRDFENWEEIAGSNLVFRLQGEQGYIHQRPALKQAWLEYLSHHQSEIMGTCLITGEHAPIAKVHAKIQGVRDAQSSGACIVSFNKKAFCSYGKDQSFNAPVSENAAFGYTTALNGLLKRDSPNKLQLGDASTVYWAERQTPGENLLAQLMDPPLTQEKPKKGQPAPDPKATQELKAILTRVRDGLTLEHADLDFDPEVTFYILGLAPNNARISIRFWQVSSFGKLVENIGWHYRDLAIEKNYENQPDFPGIWHLLRTTAALGKSENISSVFAGSLARAVFSGSPYPENLLSMIISRIRADFSINYLRAALIKAFLVRKQRLFNQTSKMEIAMSLDTSSKDTPYRLGRLFAVLEKVQKEAIKGANATIKDRFFGSASATPRVVFPQLLRLAQHHMSKAEYGGISDKLVEEVLTEIDDFPAHLSLEEQGRFALGYYHQRNAFFKKNDKTEE